MSISPISNNYLSQFFYDNSQKNDKKTGEKVQISDLQVHKEILDFTYQDDENSIQGHFNRMEMNANFEMDGQKYHIQIEVERQILLFGSSNLDPQSSENLLDTLPDEAREKVEQYLGAGGFPSELSPENVSENIFQFALSHFNHFLEGREDEKEEREKYLEDIRPAVDKGFDDALEMLDAFLTDEARDKVLETRLLTHEKLDSFMGFNLVV